MQIDIVSDTVCPWCFIGKRRIARAIAMRPDMTFDVHWRPYRLDPTIPPEGVDRRAYLKAKFGDSPRSAQMGEVLRNEGLGEGIDFHFDKVERSPNTLDSHRVIRWAASAGVQDALVERMFDAYFVQGRNIGDRAVLAEIAAGAGMDSGLVAELLDKGADREIVEKEDLLAHEMGISGVPTFIFENRYMISGAREPEVLVRIIDKAVELLKQEPA